MNSAETKNIVRLHTTRRNVLRKSAMVLECAVCQILLARRVGAPPVTLNTVRDETKPGHKSGRIRKG